MNLEEVLVDIENELSSEEQFSKLETLLEHAQKEKNADVYFDVVLLLSKKYQESGLYDDSVRILKKAYQNELLSDITKKIQLIDQLISILLKTEEFDDLLEALEIRTTYIGSDDKKKIMQKFYLAVCYEGLKEDKKAIDTLLEIPDKLSNNNLVSKYLKLSMLSLKTKEPNKAHEYYEQAVFYDSSSKNPLFSLVLSDISFYEKDYHKALEYFQDFFIKSQVKNRYLDRYLSISIAMEHFPEAIQFYKDYEPKVRRFISKNYQRMFYEAALELFLKIKDEDSYLYVYEKLNLLNHKFHESIDSFAKVQELISIFYQKNTFDKPRDILLYAARSFGKVLDTERFHFMYKEHEKVVLYTKRDQLLMEKHYAYEERSSLIDALFEEEQEVRILMKEDLSSFVDFYASSKELEAMIKVNVSSTYYKDLLICIGLVDSTQIDTARKLAQILSLLLSQSFLQHYLSSKVSKVNQSTETIVSTFGFDSLRIHENKFLKMSESLIQLLGQDLSFEPFEHLQKQIKEEVYLDDFLTQEKRILTYQKNDNSILELEVYPFLDGQDIILAIKEFKNKQNSLTEPINLQFDAYKQATTLIWLDYASLEHTPLRRDLSELYQLQDEITLLIKKDAKEHFKAFERASMKGYWLWLDTTDKRVTKRILSNLEEFIEERTYDLSIYGVTFVILKDTSFKEIETALLDIPLSPTGFITYDRSFVRERKETLMLEERFKQLLDNKECLFVKQPIKNPNSQEEIGSHIILNPKLLFDQQDKVSSICDSLHVGYEFDLVKLKSLTEIIQKDSILFISLQKDTVYQRPHLVAYLKKLRSMLKNKSNVVLLIPYLTKYKGIISQLSGYLKQYSIALGLYGFDSISLQDLSLFEQMDYIVFSNDTIRLSKSVYLTHPVIRLLNHEHHSVSKTELKEGFIQGLYGDIYPFEEIM